MHFFMETVLSTPNPFRNILNIQAETVSNDIRATLTNVLGQEIYLEMNNNQLDFSNLATGLYFVKVYSPDTKNEKTFKILKN